MEARLAALLREVDAPEPTAERLASELVRTARARHGAPTPIALAICVARAAGPSERANRLAATLLAFHGAADRFDDVHDGARSADAVAEAYWLLFAAQLGACRDPEASIALARAGGRMASGQRHDLMGAMAGGEHASAGTNLEKTGEAAGVYLALAAGGTRRGRSRWRDLGRRYGQLVQDLSDATELFARDDGPDWRLLKATRALEAVMSSGLRDEARKLVAGDRSQPGRVQAFRALVLQTPVLAQIERDAECLLRQLERTKLTPRRAADEARRAASELLKATGTLRRKASRAPRVRLAQAGLSSRVDGALEAAAQFLRGNFRELVETHRWGLFGADRVSADVFGPLVAIEALAGTRLAARLPLIRWFERVVARVDADGLRYYPGRPEIPPDTDDAGLLLQAAAALGWPTTPRAPAILRAIADIRRSTAGDGSVRTWVRSRAWNDERIREVWDGDFCPGVTANAWLGLLAARAEPRDEAMRVGARLARRLARGAHSTFYGPVVTQALVSRLFVRSGHRAALHRSLEALRRSGRLDGTFGTTLETALATRALAPHDGAEPLSGAVVALLDAQQEDGGYPADPFFRTIGRHGPRWYGSRALTTALVARALEEVGVADEDRVVPGVAAVHARQEAG